VKRIIFLSIFSLTLFTGCHQVGGGVRVDDRHNYPQQTERMPPAHAPAHGRRRQQHRYHYYPNAEFYFDIGRNLYFYLDSRGRWSMSARLPHHLYGHLRGSYVEFEMESDRPYRDFDHHKRKYKRDKHHKKNNRKNKHYYKNKKRHDDDDDEERRYREH